MTKWKYKIVGIRPLLDNYEGDLGNAVEELKEPLCKILSGFKDSLNNLQKTKYDEDRDEMIEELENIIDNFEYELYDDIDDHLTEIYDYCDTFSVWVVFE